MKLARSHVLDSRVSPPQQRWPNGARSRRDSDSYGTPQTAASVLLRSLSRLGVSAAFGIPGGAIGAIFDAFAEVPEIGYTATRHEAIAAFAGIGYARATGRPAVVLTTAGPGVTNAITGIATAYVEEVPLIVVAGEVATRAAGRGAFQDGTPGGIDVQSVLRPITRWSTVVTSAAMMSGAVHRAWRMATGDRPGPVVLSVPLDVARETCLSVITAPVPLPRPRLDTVACAEAARMLASARRPLLVLGHGARSAAAQALGLVHKLAVPVVVTGHGKGAFPERHPLYLGIIGNAGHPSAREYVEAGPDVTCIVGTRLGDFATNGWQLDVSGSRETIHIDRDPASIGRNTRTSLGIVGDAASALRAIARAVPVRLVRRPPATSGCRSVREACAQSDAVPLKPQRVLAALSLAFPTATWCADIGEHMGLAQHYVRVDRPDQFHVMSGFASMGSGIGAAIGLKLAHPERTLIAVVGDGCLNMHAGELLTCVERELAIIFAVFNDGRWNMVDHGFDALFGRRPVGLPRAIADLAAVARGYGAVGVVVDHPAQLDPDALRRLRRPRRPLVLDCRIDPAESLSDLARSDALRRASRQEGA